LIPEEKEIVPQGSEADPESVPSRIAVISTHLDDAVFSCWSIITRAQRPTVLTVCAGSPPIGIPPAPYDRLTGATDARARMLERRTEDVNALTCLGATAIHLPFLDIMYRKRHTYPMMLLFRGIHHIERQIFHAIDAAIPDGTTDVYFPIGIGGHPDHLAVAFAGILFSKLSKSNCQFHFYADLPYAETWGWPEWVSGHPPPGRLCPEVHWDSRLEFAVGHGMKLLPRVTQLSEVERISKEEACSRYTTQYISTMTSVQTIKANPYHNRFEVSWELEHESVTHKSH